MLRRSPLLLAVLVSYPLLIALLLALVAGYANAKPRVAFVDDDNQPETVEIGGRTFHVERTFRRVSDEGPLNEILGMGRVEPFKDPFPASRHTTIEDMADC